MSNFVPRGIIPPIVTPFTSEGKVDYDRLREMVDLTTEFTVFSQWEQQASFMLYLMKNTERSL